MIQEPFYKLNDKITYKSITRIITNISKYTKQELLDVEKNPDLEWMKIYPFFYIMTFDTPQSYESIILKRKFPNKPTKWIRTRYTMIIEYVDFHLVKLLLTFRNIFNTKYNNFIN
jgi:hypothetical protein